MLLVLCGHNGRVLPLTPITACAQLIELAAKRLEHNSLLLLLGQRCLQEPAQLLGLGLLRSQRHTGAAAYSAKLLNLARCRFELSN